MTSGILAYTAYWTYRRAREVEIPFNVACLMAVTWPVLGLFLLSDWFAEVWIKFFKN